MTDQPLAQASKPRIALVDMLRGLALLAMASYHGAWDLWYRGYLTTDVTRDPVWRGYSVGIASTFLFLVGFSLVLADGGDTARALKRIGQIAAGAIAVSLATYFMMGDAWIYFGVLHHIALASLLARPLLRVPLPLVVLLAVIVLALPFFVQFAAFDTRWLGWIGLSQIPPPSDDYIPLMPWFALVLAGLTVGRVARARSRLSVLAGIKPDWGQPLMFLGRHSLIFYLLHQPLLYGATALMPYVIPVPTVDQVGQFHTGCLAQCTGNKQQGCEALCSCTATTLEKNGLFERWRTMNEADIVKEVQTAANACRLQQ